MTLTPNPPVTPYSSIFRPLSFLCESSVASAPAFTPGRSERYLFLSSCFPRIAGHGTQAASIPAANHQPLVTIFFRIRTYAKQPNNPFRIRTYKTQDLKSFRMNTYEKTRGGTPSILQPPGAAALVVC